MTRIRTAAFVCAFGMAWLCAVCAFPPGQYTATALAQDQAADAKVQIPVAYKWTRVRGRAKDLAISANGIAYAVDTNNRVWRWRGVRFGGWLLLPRTFYRIAAHPQGKPWALSPDGRPFRHNGLWWERLGTAKGTDIAIGSGGHAFIVAAKGGLARWNEQKTRWDGFADRADIDAKQIAVGPEGAPWVIDAAGLIHRFDGDDFVKLPGTARDIAISPEGAVFIVAPDGNLARWDPDNSKWEPLAGITDAGLIAVGPGPFPWAATGDGRIYATAEFAAEKAPSDRIAGGPTDEALEEEARRTRARRQAIVILPESTDRSPFVFTRILREGLAEDLAIGRDGSVFATDTQGRVLLWSDQRRSFLVFPGNLHRVAVAPDGRPWGVNAAGEVLRHDGTQFVEIPDIDDASEIAIGGDGTVFVADREQRLLRFDPSINRFVEFPVSVEAVKVAVTPQGRPWVIRDDGALFRCDAAPCQRIPGVFGLNLGIGPDGSLFIVDRRNRLLLFLERRDEVEFQEIRADVLDVAVGPRGRPWIIDTERRILATTFFRQPPSQEELEEQLPPASITFTKRLNFREVRFAQAPVNLREITIGRDGSVFVWDDGVFPEVSIFNETRNRFERKVDNAESAPGCTSLPISFSTRANAAQEIDELWQVGLNAFNTAVIRRVPGAAPKDALRECEVKFNELLVDIPACSRSIDASPDGSVFFTATNCFLYEFDESEDKFVLVSPLVTNAVRVAVDPNGRPWIIDTDDRVLRFDGKQFESLPRRRAPQKATSIAIGANGTVFITDTDGFLRRYNATSDSFDRITGVKNAVDIAVAPDGLPWVITTATTVRRGQP